MEWLLLLLLGSLAAGTVYWTASARSTPPAERRPGEGEGPRSSPELPERQERAPVIEMRSRDIDRLRDMLDRVEEPVAPEVVDSGRKDSRKAADELRQRLRRRKKPLNVSYTTDQIIPRSSPHSFHRRPLQNAEQFVAQQLADEALKLYERVERRMPAEDIKEKIQTNIEDIRRWMEGLDSDEDEPLTFPEIIIPLTSQAMALEDLSDGLRKISETLARDIANALRTDGPLQLRGDLGVYPTAPPPQPPAPPSPRAESAQPQTAEKVPPSGIQPSPVSVPAPGVAAPAGVATPTAAAAPAGGATPTVAAAPAGLAAPAAAYAAAPSYAPAQAYSAPPAWPAQPPAPARQRILYLVPQKLDLAGDAQKGIPGVSLLPGAPPAGPSVPTGPADYFRHAGEEFQFDEQGRLLTDGMTDEDFKREWEKYKSLPLVDRRDVDERRRLEEAEQGREEDRPDRRAGEDRRRRDLFHQREDFLAKWKTHEERKRLLDQRGVGSLPDADVIVAAYDASIPPLPAPSALDFGAPPPLVEPIGLPEADRHPLDEALEEAHGLVDQIHAEASTGTGGHAPDELPSLALPDARAEYDASRFAAPEEMPPQARVELVTPPLDAIHLPEPQPHEMRTFPELTEPVEEGGPPAPAEHPEFAPPQEALGEGVEAADIPEMPEAPEQRGPVQEIRGVLELKPPDEDDAPFLTLTYDFSKIPDSFKLSRDYHTMEFVYYKYKPMLIKAQEFARRKMLKSALNYYRVIKSQNIPPEFRRMVNRNIQDITDYLEKFMMSRSGD